VTVPLRQGAENRARGAKGAEPECDFYFGIEGGIETDKDGKLICFAWVIVFDKVSTINLFSDQAQFSFRVLHTTLHFDVNHYL
jgi:non-canonical (house-cleaning) NTP pyrophosphatase